MPSSSQTHWTSLNIFLHWTIVALLLVQAIDHEWMIALFDASWGGKTVDGTTSILGYTHIIAGSLIFVAAAVRLWDRNAHGRPAAPDGEPAWAARIASLTHVGLYALLLSMPLAGAFAWFTGSELVATAHGWAWTALLILAGIHVAGALANHFWFKTDVLRRMMPGQGCSTDSNRA